MILEFTTTNGSTFRLDKERMLWERTYESRRTHGQLYTWIEDIKVGKHVWIFNRDVGNCGRAFCTGKVETITEIRREQPGESIDVN